MSDPIVIAPLYMVLVMAIALFSSVIGGMSGFGAGMIITPVLLPILGVKGIVPVVMVAMVVGNLARVAAYRQSIEFGVILLLLVAILPGSLIGVWLYAYMPASFVAVVIGTVLILSVPLRRHLSRHEIVPKRNSVSVIAFLCGVLAGNAPGGGVIIISLLLSLGLSGPALLGTDAVIGMAISLTNASLFGGFGLLDMQRLVMGIAIGLAMFPGAFVARAIVGRLSTRVHIRIIEVFVICGGLSFYWAAFSPS